MAGTGWERVRRGRAGRACGRGATAITDQHADLLDEHRRALARLAGAAIRLSAQTGLRLGELRALRWKDVDWSNGVVHVRRNAPTSAPAARAEKTPKSGRVRSVPMTDDTIRILDELSRRDRFTGPEDYVLPSPTGERLDGNDLRNAFYAALDRADLGHLRRKEDPIVWHDLRHTFGTMAVRVAPVTDVKEWTGHAHLSTTMRYVHYIPRHDAGKLFTQAFAHEPVHTGARVPPVPDGV